MQTRDEVESLHNCRGQAVLLCFIVFISGCANTGKQFCIAFIKELPLKTTMWEKIKKKKSHFPDQNVSSYNTDLITGFLNRPIKTHF